jgi:hypothetical protein
MGGGGSRHGGEVIWGSREDGKLTRRSVHGSAHGWEVTGDVGPRKPSSSSTHRS